MKFNKKILLEKAFSAKRESKYIEFKESFDIESTQDWCEIIKDIIAIANSGGGVLIIGVNNNGKASGFDCTKVLTLDPASITDKIYKYTNINFHSFEIEEIIKLKKKIAVIIIFELIIPIPFCKPGTYPHQDGKQKTAFSQGTLYFRHGAKSETCNLEDLKDVIDRNLENIKKSWLGNIRKVVNASSESVVTVAPSNFSISSNKLQSTTLKITNDNSAPLVRITRDKTLSQGLFMHEELSDGIFEEINNVIEVNEKLRKGKLDFMLDENIYYRIYSERESISFNEEIFELMVNAAFKKFYAPSFFWMLRLPVSTLTKIIEQNLINAKSPFINTLIKLVVLLGQDGMKWLHHQFEQSLKLIVQKPNYYYSFDEVYKKKRNTDLKLQALRVSGTKLVQLPYSKKTASMEYLLKNKTECLEELSKTCHSIYEGKNEYRSIARLLDVLCYGDAITAQASKVIEKLNQITILFPSDVYNVGG